MASFMKCSCFEYVGTNIRTSGPGRLTIVAICIVFELAKWVSFYWSHWKFWSEARTNSRNANIHWDHHKRNVEEFTVYSVPRFQCLYLFSLLFLFLGGSLFIHCIVEHISDCTLCGFIRNLWIFYWCVEFNIKLVNAICLVVHHNFSFFFEICMFVLWHTLHTNITYLIESARWQQ